MIARSLLLGVCLVLASCQSSGKEDVSAALTPRAAAGDPAFPVKTKDGLQFGGNRAIANQCMVPDEGKQGGKPLTQAMIDAWPQAFVSDIAIMQAALAGVAYPEEVAYIQDCMLATVAKPQTPGQLPEGATTQSSAPKV